jgi:cell division protein FtsQ
MKRSKILHLLFMLAILVGSVVLTKIRSNDLLTSELVVNFKGKGARFLDVEIVNKLLIQSDDSLFFQQKYMVALNKVEQQFLDHPVVKSAELFTVPEGKLHIEIEERLPIVRIQANNSFYLDEVGKVMPLSDRFTAKVPLFYGELKEENMQALVLLISKLSSDAFLAAEVIDFQWQNSAFVLGLRSYPFEVVWGEDIAFEHKVEKLKRFCAFTLENKDKKFNRINLTYDKQVVARHN